MKYSPRFTVCGKSQNTMVQDIRCIIMYHVGTLIGKANVCDFGGKRNNFELQVPG